MRDNHKNMWEPLLQVVLVFAFFLLFFVVWLWLFRYSFSIVPEAKGNRSADCARYECICECIANDCHLIGHAFRLWLVGFPRLRWFPENPIEARDAGQNVLIESCHNVIWTNLSFSMFWICNLGLLKMLLLCVSSVPPHIPSCEVPRSVFVGSDLELLCKDKQSAPPATYSWYKDNRALKVSSNITQISSCHDLYRNIEIFPLWLSREFHCARFYCRTTCFLTGRTTRRMIWWNSERQVPNVYSAKKQTPDFLMWWFFYSCLASHNWFVQFSIYFSL